MIGVSDLRNNTKVEMDGGIWECLQFQHQKIGRGGAKVVAKFKNLETGAIVEKSFNGNDKLQDIFIDYRPMQYLFSDGDMYTFMDLETYEQPSFSKEQIGDAVIYLVENLEVKVDFYKDKPIKVTLPTTVELTIVETDPGLKGDTAAGGTKPAKLESGATVTVPLFIEQGTKIKVDTRTGEYLGRV